MEKRGECAVKTETRKDRNRTYLIIENGEIYKAYNGFTDDYTGERYKSISDDMYTKPTDGYIEK